METVDLLKRRQKVEQDLAALVYGSVEVREKDGKDYLYTHYREDGRLLTKYVGEFSDELYNLILNNNIRAKSLKQEIKKIDKRLEELGYIERELPEEVAENIDFARRHLVDTIYQQAVLEGVATTFADTEKIIEGAKVQNMAPDDIRKVVNLKHAWDFVLSKSTILSDSNFGLLTEINRLVEEGFYYSAGKVRNVPVSIGGTNWKPEVPLESVVREKLAVILARQKSTVDKAIDLLLYIMKTQIFIDGNKRTAVIFANHFLITRGKGMIIIPAEKTERFKELLIEFYEGKDTKKIKNFLREKCYLTL